MIPSFKHIDISFRNKVAFAHLNRPKKANALNKELWFEMEKLAHWVEETPEVRVLVIAGNGKHFTAGIDYSLIMSLFAKVTKRPEGHKQEMMFKEILKLQQAFTALEQCSKPVIAAIHGSCLGGGIDLICACDMRYGSSDSVFCIKEVDLAIVADIGTLQRIPRIIGEGLTRELAYTGRNFSADEAKTMGLLNGVYVDQDTLMQEVEKIAQQIAEKSPLTIRGIKRVLNYSRDHGVEDGLRYVATWNASMLLSVDGQESMKAMMTKRKPTYLD